MNIYETSCHASGNTTVCMVNGDDFDYLLVTGDTAGFVGTQTESGLEAPLTHENAQELRRLFPFTAPKPILTSQRTIGLGDRLGLATPGQLRAVARYDALPILAQQSIRELDLTNRTFADVLDSATFAVFREDFQRGFGADGDHLKTDEQVKYALDCGFTMITLDCSEHIRNDVNDLSAAEVEAQYEANAELEAIYCDKSFPVEDCTVDFSADEFRRTCLIYGKAIEHAVHIYETFIKNAAVDFEISIDETMTPTTPAQHFFVANELIRRGVKVATVAPRFCGEFQKGVDYIGDLAQFEAEFKVHAAIARHFGYKVSVHSGSDKFSVFPYVGRYTRGIFHVKTAGTNWLEAMRVVAECDAALYREIHQFALDHFSEATRYYHVTTDLSKIPALSTLSDEQLPSLFTMNDGRQLIHITYGLILNAKDASGSSLFRDRLYHLWRECAEIYAQHLDRHISKHLELLYSGI